MNRQAEIKRKTRETDVNLWINLDGTGNAKLDTGIGFLDHMLELFSKHGFFDLKVQAKGDIHVDYHHTVEDIGICLGEGVAKALVDKRGIRRYGAVSLPMDEALVDVALDISGRGMLIFNVKFSDLTTGMNGDDIKRFDVELVKEFFRAFSQHSSITIHINLEYGENSHHIIEAIFKAFARALCLAVEVDKRIEGVLSTKGMI
ncbi:imidazoleglycerol-phosphate dehydratase [Candidatus Desantisbacteria bacterium CG2_30_40_21]|uniref:Imidazoleglycerol-phosphate dehydratase n=5 Tax=unclassified Candidatus Desantisiibacteriota TaxID=3106372 RepID=A0A2M7JDK0_9BACT|nr:MAG: imidazoleglycerol-phosphate dehydratase [Candidatus Desantisbacteria bacterium CG2_30_40_21]PIP40683.1 MAG: imidazoleglycerol-phosphate dehydratase [Candidatus Desantisbacteria bacterium CG23_combo_of_CG06-09_8_20_14_all_40_23]PIX17488.1 MAG: imidazoleglycerol-phosphate dehydratase HisB [Candidatus Desantisbacteria bacterium CG_4_8_14_3_um_filter_40_12]PIY19658.1 MAG: imidazoleglycerol-phosphate dehydratase HisB [Candidatus Desantisbacteria bacterium CG_4_10_14_3_um_filter_40_18]PJB2908